MSERIEILFEDDWIVVARKPAGMLSVGYPGYRGKSAQDILTERYKNRGKIRIAVIHRLDRETSGIMVFAKTGEAKKRFMDSWQEIVTERTYRCVCVRARGAEPLSDSGTIDAPISYNAQDKGYVDKKGDPKAQRAVTRYRVIERGAERDLLECELETGRKNQIRIHMAHLGHPVSGDSLYGISSNEGGKDEQLALHARVLAFNHPFTGETLRFEDPEPAFFKTLAGGEPKKGAVKAGTAKVAPDARKLKGGAPSSRAPKERDAKRTEEIRPAAERTAEGKLRPRKGSGGSRFIPGK